MRKNYNPRDLELGRNSIQLSTPEDTVYVDITFLQRLKREIRYHPVIANVVVDALSRKERILEAQSKASKGVNTLAKMLKGLDKQLERKEDGRLYLAERIWETTDKIVKIKERLKVARDRQKSYADNRRKPLEFNVDDKVLLKMSPRKGVVRFEMPGRCKFSCTARKVKIDNKVHFVEEPMEIMDREVKKLKKRWIPIVKVRWNSRRGPEFNWEREDETKRKYPQYTVRGATA
ncbi:hypothetical protein Tco_0188772 [Tanacetum coccineum]